MECPECGAPVPDEGDARCPACQHPPVGEPRRAPEGSDPPPAEPSKPRTSNALFWGALTLAFLAALALMFL